MVLGVLELCVQCSLSPKSPLERLLMSKSGTSKIAACLIAAQHRSQGFAPQLAGLAQDELPSCCSNSELLSGQGMDTTVMGPGLGQPHLGLQVGLQITLGVH